MIMTILNIFSSLNIKHIYILSLVLAYVLGSFLIYKKIFSDPELKKFFLDSLRESSKNGGCEGKPSGKSLTAFLLSNIIGVATIIAVIYAPQHLLPEYFLICILSFVASLYGISMASKYFGNGNSNVNSNVNTTETTSTSILTSTSKTNDAVVEEKDKENDKPKNDDIG